jgi:hypothetical protein
MHCASMPQPAWPLWGAPDVTAVQVPAWPWTSQAMHESAQAVSQQVLSGEQNVPARHPPAVVEQSCPCLLLQAPWPSQVPAHLVRSSWFFTVTQAPAEQA